MQLAKSASIPRPLLALLFLAGAVALTPPPAAANGWEHTSIDFAVLLAALDDDNPAIRRRAAESLGFRQQPGTAEALLARLDKNEPVARVRQDIFHALGRLGSMAALQAIEECLAGESEAAVRVECARAPGNIVSPRAEVLALRASEDDNRQVRLQAIVSLGSFSGPATLQKLQQFSADADESIRSTALLALGRGRSRQAAAILLDALKEAADEKQTIIALQALTLLGDPATVDELRAVYSASADETVRQHALVAMASTRAQGSDVFFLDALDSNDPDSRILGLSVLREYGDRGAVDAIVEHALTDCARLFESGSAQLMQQPLQTLAELQLLNEYLKTVIRLAPAAGAKLYLPAARLRSIPRNSTTALKIAEGFYRARWQAVYGLGYTDAAVAGNTLRAAADDADARIRAIAIRSMGVTGHAGFVKTVQSRLSDEAAEVRWTAARVLGRSSSADPAALIASLRDAHAQVRLESALALGYLKAQAARADLTELANSDPDARVSEAAGFAVTLID